MASATSSTTTLQFPVAYAIALYLSHHPCLKLKLITPQIIGAVADFFANQGKTESEINARMKLFYGDSRHADLLPLVDKCRVIIPLTQALKDYANGKRICEINPQNYFSPTLGQQRAAEWLTQVLINDANNEPLAVENKTN